MEEEVVEGETNLNCHVDYDGSLIIEVEMVVDIYSFTGKGRVSVKNFHNL